MNKTVLITGASHGIGKQSAITFAQAGYNVIINYNKSKKEALSLEAELKAAGFGAMAVEADVSCQTAANQMFDKVQEFYGGVDVLINNAAISSIKPLQDISLDEWKKTFEVNVHSAFICSKLALSYMINKKSGCIINVSSMWGCVGASCEVHYSSSKAALIGFTKALAKELAPSGIRVNCVCPGVTETAMNSHLSQNEKQQFCNEIPLGRFAKPSEIAKSILFLASDDASYITGQILSPNGGAVM